jgi:hypothetical protein
MNILQLDELFRAARPEDALDYLWGRLQDRDLGPDEALALLGAIHHELSAARAGDPKVYLSYTRFMESLSREMPLVHDYVVAHWIESRRAARRQPKARIEAPASLDEDDQTAPHQQAPVSAGAVPPAGMIPVVGGGSNEPAEAGGPDDGMESEGDEPSPDN